MVVRSRQRIWTAASLLGLTACRVAGLAETTPVQTEASPQTEIEDRQRAEQFSVRPGNSWPREFAGRTGYVVTDQYVAYAKDARVAEELRKWLDRELAAFRSEHVGACEGTGLVIAIEREEDLPPNVAAWRWQNVDRARLVEWRSPVRSQFFSSPRGRPYCLDNEPYFTESFEIPPDDAAGLGIDPNSPDIYPTPKPAWVGFLATDEHVTSAFDTTLQRLLAARDERISREVPLAVRLLSYPALGLFAAMAAAIYPEWRSIDVDLMHLQRRETLRRALINCSVNDPGERDRRLRTLRDDIDGAWKELWFRRPFD